MGLKDDRDIIYVNLIEQTIELNDFCSAVAPIALIQNYRFF